MKLPRFLTKKIRKNPDSGKKPDSKIFRIFSKMDFSWYFVIIKCFSFFNITIFKAAMAVFRGQRPASIVSAGTAVESDAVASSILLCFTCATTVNRVSQCVKSRKVYVFCLDFHSLGQACYKISKIKEKFWVYTVHTVLEMFYWKSEIF